MLWLSSVCSFTALERNITGWACTCSCLSAMKMGSDITLKIPGFPQPSLPADYSPFCPPTSSYTAMTAMTPVAAAQRAGTTADRSSPLLPICPLPTEKTIDSVFYAPKQTALLCSCTESLLDPSLLIHLLGKGDKTRDAFQFCKSVIEESLNSIVAWAKNAPYFEQLPVSWNLYELEFASRTNIKIRKMFSATADIHCDVFRH